MREGQNAEESEGHRENRECEGPEDCLQALLGVTPVSRVPPGSGFPFVDYAARGSVAAGTAPSSAAILRMARWAESWLAASDLRHMDRPAQGRGKMVRGRYHIQVWMPNQGYEEK
jgi:hypothetical protein